MLPILIISKDKIKQNEKLVQILTEKKIDKINIQEIIPEKSFSIEDARNLKKTIFLKALNSKEKTVIIHKFETASIDAQNSMLKMLEEPPLDTQIILLSYDENLLPTVLSRCKIIKLKSDIAKSEINLVDEFEKIISSSISEKLFIAQEKARDKENLNSWIENLSAALSDNFALETNKNTVAKHYFILKNLNEAYYQLNHTNIQARFILENLFLSSPSELNLA